MKQDIIQTFEQNGLREFDKIDVSSVQLFDLKTASKRSVIIHKKLQEYTKAASDIRFYIGVMAYNIKTYQFLVNANYTIGQAKMDTLVKLNPAAYYTATRKVRPEYGYF